MSELRFNRGLLLLFAATTALCWLCLTLIDPAPDWLSVEAPRVVMPGEVVPLRVRVRGLDEATYVCADLHWAGNPETSNGFLASGGTRHVQREGGTVDFKIRAEDLDGLHYVQGVIYLSPSGNWSNHTRVAVTELIPVNGGFQQMPQELAALKVRELNDSRTRTSQDTPAVVRWLIALLWFATALATWLSRRAPGDSPTGAANEGRWWAVLTPLLVLAGIWELFDLGNWIGIQARVWARTEELYHTRNVIQKVISSMIPAVALICWYGVLRKRNALRPPLIFFGIYLILVLLDFVSLHALDQYARLTWHKITPLAALKGVCASGVFIGVCRACSRKRQP